jgi:nitroreductase
MNLIEKLNWRYATKRMNGQVVSDSSLNNILEAMQLAPSSMGLQPFTFIVISNKELLQKIHAQACQQPQILEASHVIVLAAWKSINEKHINDYIQNIADTRGATLESLEGFKNMLLPMTKRTNEENNNWAARQAYIALGFGLVAAANEGVDATPMEGFNPAAMDELLGLKEKNLGSVVVMPLGFRHTENDYLINAKKVRRDKKDLFIIMS